MTQFRILSLDPGTVNFGWAVTEVYRQRARVVRCGMLSGMVKGLVLPVGDDADKYTARIERLLNKGQPSVLLAERYSTRIRGTTGEAVNFMNGIAVRCFRDRHSQGEATLLMAMTWKAHVRKWLGDEIKPFYKLCGIPPHPVDACLIAQYWCYKSWGMKIISPDRLAKQIRGAYQGV